MNGFQVKRILRWQEKRESPGPEVPFPFSPSSYHIPKTETQKIGPQEMADSAAATTTTTATTVTITTTIITGNLLTYLFAYLLTYLLTYQIYYIFFVR